MVKSAFTILSILIWTMSFGQETKTFNKDNISFEIPSDWVIHDFSGIYILVSEPAKDQVSVTTTFDVAIAEGHKSLKKYCKSYENDMSHHEQFKDFQIQSKKDIIFKGMKAVEYHCTATVMNLKVEWRSIVFFKDGKAYKLSTTSMVGQFSAQKETTDKIFDSFEIK